MARWLTWLVVLGAGLAALLGINTLRLDAGLPQPTPARPAFDEDGAVRRLSEALQIITLSADGTAASLVPFDQLHGRLAQWFPNVHAAMPPERVNGAALLFVLEGSQDCPALLLAAHQDVVPVEPGTEADWRHPPYSGAIEEGAVWGRGAIDDKSSMLAILEALEALLAEGFRPRCPLLLAFGHDEEVGGRQGAASIAALLAARQVRVAAVLDEGGAITSGLVPGSDLPLASIGVAEKGYLSLQLTAQAEGGHSSMPPSRTAIGRLASAVALLEAERPAPRLSPVLREMLARIAPHAAPGLRVALANLWLFEPLVVARLAQSPTTDATLRTTTAPTLLRAGIKDNILPQQAEAVVNFRIQPGDSVDAVTERVRRMAAEFDVQVGPVAGFAGEPSAAADWNAPLFRQIEHSLRAVSEEPALLVAPYVTSGATDARHYAALTPQLFRFAPMRLDAGLMASFHGSNERIPIVEYRRMLRFYWHLLRATAEPAQP